MSEHVAIQTRQYDYADGDVQLRASVSWNDSITGKRPGVLVSHAWRGRSPFEDGKAQALAEQGYVGFALDLFGAGVLGQSPEENKKLMQPFLDDRDMLQRRLQVALEHLRGLPEVDADRIAGIGFCFGGLCMLDLARSGADVRGVVSFHGLLTAPPNVGETAITARVLVLHGWDDPMATPDAVLALSQELSAAKADWQLHAYGGTLHAFTNPAADDPAHGLQYDARAEARSWRSMTNFLNEIFD